ncbi:MAG: PDZ domain-containing protein [Phycisphaerales bacterium]|nr:PDZ domain-containing protein [Phycisphaerales bacterium]
MALRIGRQCLVERAAAALVFAAGLVGGPTVGAQTVDPKLLAGVDQWIKDLDSSELDKRDFGQSRLGDGRFCSLGLIQGRFFDPGLSEEQRLRLNSAGYRLFTGSVRGAMGVQFSDSTPQGVVIGRTIEGFDSRVTLRPEDVIRTIDGRPALDQDHVRALIISHDPGDEVSVGLLRNGEPLMVTLRMGRFDQLRDRNLGPDEQALQQAWRVRLARLAREAAARLPAPIDAVDVEAEQEDFDLALALERARGPVAQDDDGGYGIASLVAGGEPRGLGAGGAPAYIVFRGGGMPGQADPVGELLRELNATQRAIIEIQDQLLEIRAIMEDPNTPAARRQELGLRGQLMEAQLRQFEEQVRNIKQRLAQGPQLDRAVP